MTGWKYPDGGGWRPSTSPKPPIPATPERYRPGDTAPTFPPPVPPEICGAPDKDGHACTFLADHVDNQPLHTWERW